MKKTFCSVGGFSPVLFHIFFIFHIDNDVRRRRALLILLFIKSHTFRLVLSLSIHTLNKLAYVGCIRYCSILYSCIRCYFGWYSHYLRQTCPEWCSLVFVMVQCDMIYLVRRLHDTYIYACMCHALPHPPVLDYEHFPGMYDILIILNEDTQWCNTVMRANHCSCYINQANDTS